MILNRELVLVDICETSARSIEDWVYPIVNSRYWTNFTHDSTEDYRDVFWNRILEGWKPIGIQRKIEIFNWAILEDKWKNLIRPIVWSVEKILKLSDSYNVWMLTARHSMLIEYTKEWVKHYYNWAVCKVLFSNSFHGWIRRKSDICLEEWVRIMIEDDMDYALEIAQNWTMVYLLSKPWNKHRKETHKNLKRIDTWADLEI